MNKKEYDIEVKIRPDAALLAPALSSVRAYAEKYFDNKVSIEKIVLALEEAIGNVISFGYSKHLDEIVIRICAENGVFTVSVYDKGMPGDYEKTLKGEDRLGLDIMRGAVDEMRIENLGIEGRCQRMIKYYGKKLDIGEETQHKEQEQKVIENPEITVRTPKKNEMLQVSRELYQEYGMTYPKDVIYYPDRFYAAVEADTIHSSVAVDQYGNVAGHHAAFQWDLVPGVWESGMGVVSGNYRNAGIFSKMMNRTFTYIHDEKEGKIFLGGCVTTHPYSMKMRLKFGSFPVGYKLNQAPPDMVVSSFKGENDYTHEAFACSVYDFTEKTVYAPKEIQPALEMIYGWLKLPRTIVNEGKEPEAEHSECIMQFNNRLRSGEMNMTHPGKDYAECLQDNIMELKRQNAESICLYISATDPAMPLVYEAAKNAGFFFTCLLPNADQGDVIMMQAILLHMVNYDQICTVEPFDQLLNFIRSLDPDQQNLSNMK